MYGRKDAFYSVLLVHVRYRKSTNQMLSICFDVMHMHIHKEMLTKHPFTTVTLNCKKGTYRECILMNKRTHFLRWNPPQRRTFPSEGVDNCAKQSSCGNHALSHQVLIVVKQCTQRMLTYVVLNRRLFYFGIDTKQIQYVNSHVIQHECTVL